MGDAAGEVEETRTGCVGAPFFDVGDGFSYGLGEVGVAVSAFSKKCEGFEVFCTLGEPIWLTFGMFEVLGGIVGV